jgi:hypothetical protein
MRSIVAAFVMAAALAAGCAATVAADGYGPELVTVSPGVQVIADYDEPIFYSDGLYWRYYGGVWYRSSYYTGGWVYATPPVAVLRINQPYAYRHYRPAGWAGRPRYYAPAPATGYRGTPPAYRAAPAPAAGYRGAPPAAAARRPPPGPAPLRAAPPAARPAPGPGRGAPPPHSNGHGWRGHP